MGALKRANQEPRQLRPINLREEGIRSPPIFDCNAFRHPQSRPVPYLPSSYSHSTFRTIGLQLPKAEARRLDLTRAAE